MDDLSAQFRVELYYQASVPAANTKPVVETVTVVEGGNLYLEDKEHEHPNLPHYNFRVVRIGGDTVTLEQIADRRGQVRTFSGEKPFRLEPEKPFRISLNVPGGGPVWTITWMGPDAGERPE